MSSFSDIAEITAQVERAWTDAAVQGCDAVGVAVDDPDNPRVAVTVHSGRIVYIGIGDGMLQGDIGDLQITLNACILTAFSQWNAQRSGLM